MGTLDDTSHQASILLLSLDDGLGPVTDVFVVQLVGGRASCDSVSYSLIFDLFHLIELLLERVVLFLALVEEVGMLFRIWQRHLDVVKLFLEVKKLFF